MFAISRIFLPLITELSKKIVYFDFKKVKKKI